MSDCSCERQDGYANCCRAKSLEQTIENRNLWAQTLEAERDQLQARVKNLEGLKALYLERDQDFEAYNKREDATQALCDRYRAALEEIASWCPTPEDPDKCRIAECKVARDALSGKQLASTEPRESD